MGELGQLCEMCFLFSDQNTVVITWWHTTHTTGTRVGIHTCACSRVKGSLREHERACALNAWRAIPLILAFSHPSPPTFLQPILLPISPLAKWLHFMELQECGGFCHCCCLPLGYAGKLALLFLLLTLWLLPLIIYSTGDLKGSIMLLYSSEMGGKKSR